LEGEGEGEGCTRHNALAEETYLFVPRGECAETGVGDARPYSVAGSPAAFTEHPPHTSELVGEERKLQSRNHTCTQPPK